MKHYSREQVEVLLDKIYAASVSLGAHPEVADAIRFNCDPDNVAHSRRVPLPFNVGIAEGAS